MTLRARFVLCVSTIAFLSLGGAFSAVWLTFNAAQERQRDAALVTEAEDDARQASYTPDWIANHLVVAPSSGPLVGLTRYAAIYQDDAPSAASRHPVAWTANLDSARPAASALGVGAGPVDFWWNNEHLRSVLVRMPGPDRRTLWLAAPRTDLDTNAFCLLRVMIAAALVAVAAAGLGAAWLSRVLTRDHERMARVARAVSAGDLAARVGPLSTDEETAQLGRDLDEMISRLAILVETQRRFIANASHELRSPLTTLLGELSFALQRDRDVAELRASIEEALHATRHLKRLTEDLLTLARIGASHATSGIVSLSEVTRAAVEATRAAWRDGGVTVESSSIEGWVQGHAGDLERLLRNLVENAIRHSPPGGRIRVDASCAADAARIVVSDDGPGVPEEARERIFEPFFRLDSARAEHGGAGLGLAIGRGIARAHGGDLWLDAPATGAGACFVLRLPLVGAPPAALRSAVDLRVDAAHG